MKNLSISKKNKYTIVFFAVACLIFFYVLFTPPMPGIADQNDFRRVMNSSGLLFKNQEAHTQNLFKYVTVEYQMEKFPTERFFMLRPSISHIYPIFIARTVCKALGFKYFNTRVLAVIFGLFYILFLSLIYRFLLPRNPVLNVIIAFLILFIFLDSNYIIWFNSLYGEPMMIVALVMFIASNLILIRNIKRIRTWHLLFFCIGSIALLGAKLQCVVILPLIIYLIIRYCTIIKKRVFAFILVLLISLYSYGVYFDVAIDFQIAKQTIYHSIFYGLLMDSDNPTQDLKDLGLNTDMVCDIGKHAYLPVEQYEKYYPYSQLTNKEFQEKISYPKIVKFYLSHPRHLYKALQHTAENSFNTGTFLGKYEKGVLDNYNHNIRNHYWSSFRKFVFPKNFAFIAGFFALLILMSIYEYKKSNTPKNKLLIELFCVIMFIGILQYPMPYILNGKADVSKQLYLFNIIFDIMIFVSVVYIIKKVPNLIITNFPYLIKRDKK